MKAFETGNYTNLFTQYGIPQEEIDKKLKRIFKTFFYGSEEERIFHPVGEDMGYLEDTGNNDARTEGMSYGMMFCVQMNMKEEFDRIWKWAKTYMYTKPGDNENEGYFAWSCATNGEHNADGPAPDGEEFFAMSLFFASHRWGDGEGIFNYSHEAREILRAMVHKGSNGREGAPMFNNENHYILFVPGCDYTDPSYHLPHFYELFALWAYEEDRPFFKEAARASRDYLAKACHPVTGLNPEYGEFDGSPMSRPLRWTKFHHDYFYSDSYRTVANIALDYEWFGIDAGQVDAVRRQQEFILEKEKEDAIGIYKVDGEFVEKGVLHPVGLMATTAQGALATTGELQKTWVMKFWDMELREGGRRYYDNCLFLFAFLALSGNYRIW